MASRLRADEARAAVSASKARTQRLRADRELFGLLDRSGQGQLSKEDIKEALITGKLPQALTSLAARSQVAGDTSTVLVPEGVKLQPSKAGHEVCSASGLVQPEGGRGTSSSSASSTASPSSDPELVEGRFLQGLLPPSGESEASSVLHLKEVSTPAEVKALLNLAYDGAKPLVDTGLRRKGVAEAWRVGEEIVLQFADGVAYFDKVTKVTFDEVTTSNFGLSAKTGEGFYVKCQAFAMAWA